MRRTRTKPDSLRQEQDLHLSKSLMWIMSIGCGASVANLYYNQPLLADMAATFHVSAREIGGISMLTQIGYALGLFLFVPLGDMKERRRLIVGLLLAVVLSLVGVAEAGNLAVLGLTSFLLGTTTVVPQLLVPLAVHLAPPGQQGKVVGTVMSGLLFGILLARTVSGFIGQSLGWRAMYLIAAAMMLLLSVLLRLNLPESRANSDLSYIGLLRSLWQLLTEQPDLREAALMGAMLFGAFSAFWSTLVFFIGQTPYHYGAQIAGLFGLVGVVGASIAPVAGRLSDKRSPCLVAGIAAFITLVAFGVLFFLGHEIWGLILGVILLDLGVQAAQISNQARIYSLVPDAKNRVNTIYMVTYFLGGALGSWLGTFSWSVWHWSGVTAVGSAMILISLAVWSLRLLTKRPSMAQT